MFRKNPLLVIVVLVLVLTVLVLALPSVALADAGGPPDAGAKVVAEEVPTDPGALIDYLSTIPIAIAVSAIVDWTIIRNWPWFRSLNPTIKFFAVLILFLLYPCLVTFAGYINDSITGITVDSAVVRASYYDALFRGGLAWVSAIITHPATKAKRVAV